VGRVKGHENWLGWNLIEGVLFFYTMKKTRSQAMQANALNALYYMHMVVAIEK
jgi:hypothetical protein